MVLVYLYTYIYLNLLHVIYLAFPVYFIIFLLFILIAYKVKLYIAYATSLCFTFKNFLYMLPATLISAFIFACLSAWMHLCIHAHTRAFVVDVYWLWSDVVRALLFSISLLILFLYTTCNDALIFRDSASFHVVCICI